MAHLKHRLDRLARSVRKLAGGVCPLCYGFPVAAVHKMVDSDPNGPGFRETGELYLAEGDDRRIDDHLSCKRCGAKARVTYLMTIVGIYTPTGRRIWDA